MRFRTSRLLPVGIGLGLALVGLAGYALAAGYVVSLTQNGPSPDSFNATLGDTVTFVNNDYRTHTIVASKLGLTSPAIGPGQSFTWVVTASGKLAYRQEGKPTGSGMINVTKIGSVTLGASKSAINYHSSPITLTGTTSFPAATVTIEQHTATEKKWAEVTKLTPGSDGSFSFTVTPEVSTDYRANVFSGELLSKDIAVEVRPIVTLTTQRRKLRGGTFLTLRSHVVPAEAVKSIDLVRYDSQRQEWHRVSSKVTKTGNVFFRWQVEFGRSALRASISKRGLTKGYAAAMSKTVVVTGTGTPPTRKHRRHK